MTTDKLRELWYSSECETRHCIKTQRDLHDQLSQSFAAQDCADDYHSNHDGWEASWPREFTLYESEEGPALASYAVDREAIPQFTARKK